MAEIKSYPDNYIRFLGTAGTRFIMLSQRRSSGGIWFSYGSARGVIDPGPGSLVQICKASPPLSTIDINTLIITHRHIDHSSDLNVLVEGMTLKSREPRGCVLLTKDSVEKGDAVLLKYAARRVKNIYRHKNRRLVEITPDVTVESVKHSHHGVQCYGLIFRSQGLPTWGLISDSRPLKSFPRRYADCELLIMNVTLPFPRPPLEHLSIPDAASLLACLSPRLALLTHMGQFILDSDPQKTARRLCTDKTAVLAAEDGMIVDFADFNVFHK